MVFSALLLDGAPAAGDWPAARHDPQRTGATPSTSNIVKPAPYWRAYLGGVLSTSKVLADDVNQDGEIDLLFVSGGRVVLSDPQGFTHWSTPSLGFLTLHALDDLDGDGRLEAVVLSGAGAAVVAGATGEILWREDASELGSLGAARLADLDGDGHLDLFLDECGCCSVRTNSPGVIYSFARGFDAVERLPPPPQRVHCSAAVNTVGDWDGNGIADLLVSSHDRLFFVSGQGTVFAESASIGAYLGGAVCEAVTLGDPSSPRQHALCFQNRVVGQQGAREISLLTYRRGESPSLAIVWRRTLGPRDGGDARAPTQLAWDLDGDGALEVLVSGSTGGSWTTHVLDAATGDELAVLPDEIARGAVPGSSGGEQWIITSREERVSAFRFSRRRDERIERLWSLDGLRVRTRMDWSSARRNSHIWSLVTPDLTGDGRGELVLETTSEPVALTAYEVLEGGASPAAAYRVESGVGIAAVDVLPGLPPSAAPRLAVSRDDGFVTLLDASLAPTNLVREGRDVLPGLRVGGYSTGPGAYVDFGRAPLAAKLSPGDKADSVVVVDSRGDLIRLVAEGASNVAPAGGEQRGAGQGHLARDGRVRRVHRASRGRRAGDPRLLQAAAPDHRSGEVLGRDARRERGADARDPGGEAARVGRAAGGPRRGRRPRARGAHGRP
ncbi:hypothetical protein BE08_09335 [Sorangium cellulosum]|uniref:VCBS repeat-containing protein n=1 Tax=Sorangium cellulosum TaxID=56 RepID=A0A150P4P5_SORCE|nr:hypothetical protein BE08_09335 [Sorangium cellulosum]